MPAPAAGPQDRSRPHPPDARVAGLAGDRVGVLSISALRSCGLDDHEDDVLAERHELVEHPQGEPSEPYSTMGGPPGIGAR